MSLRLGLIAPLVLACSLAAPGPTTQPTSPPTAAPTVAPTPASTPPPTAYQGDQPPSATLASSAGTVFGLAGTYCWRGTCADTFEIPNKTRLPDISVAAGESLTFALAGGASFLSWQASYGPGSMATLMLLDEGGADYDPYTSSTPPPPLSEAEFGAPPSGDWVVYVVIRSTEGEAHYMWHTIVP